MTAVGAALCGCPSAGCPQPSRRLPQHKCPKTIPNQKRFIQHQSDNNSSADGTDKAIDADFDPAFGEMGKG